MSSIQEEAWCKVLETYGWRRDEVSRQLLTSLDRWMRTATEMADADAEADMEEDQSETEDSGLGDDSLDEEEEEEEESTVWEDAVMSLVLCVDESVTKNPQRVTEPSWEDELEDFLYEMARLMTCPAEHPGAAFFASEQEEEYSTAALDELVNTAREMWYLVGMPLRSHPTTFAPPLSVSDMDRRAKHIAELQRIEQPEQRTEAWYEMRYELITASAAYKAFESQAVQNQLIYEKCQPRTNQSNWNVSVDSPLHWGQKYEPLSVMLYEEFYQTRVGEFGCIRHRDDAYRFLGASPDGINLDPASPRFGRMLEIKNIVNRPIDGIPKKEYWVQMQLQMEVWDLDECDFWETRFLEYPDEESFRADGHGSDLLTHEEKHKGVLLYFAKQDGSHHYEYMPRTVRDVDEAAAWRDATMERLEGTLTWVRTIYWWLETSSCVLVERNRRWFADNVGILQQIWKTIEEERQTGAYVHRAPKKRVTAAGATGGSATPSGYGYGGVWKAKALAPPTQVIKVRTQSFDETGRGIP